MVWALSQTYAGVVFFIFLALKSNLGVNHTRCDTVRLQLHWSESETSLATLLQNGLQPNFQANQILGRWGGPYWLIFPMTGGGGDFLVYHGRGRGWAFLLHHLRGWGGSFLLHHGGGRGFPSASWRGVGRAFLVHHGRGGKGLS